MNTISGDAPLFKKQVVWSTVPAYSSKRLRRLRGNRRTMSTSSIEWPPCATRSATRKRRLEGEVPAGRDPLPYLFEKQSTRGEQLTIRRERRETRSDEIGIHERSTRSYLREILQGKRRFTRAIRASDDSTDGAHDRRLLPLSLCIMVIRT